MKKDKKESFKDFLAMSVQELMQTILELRKFTLNARFSKAHSKVIKPHVTKEVRKNIARILTAINAKNREQKGL